MLPERQGNRMDSLVDTTRIEKELAGSRRMTVKQYIESPNSKRGESK